MITYNKRFTFVITAIIILLIVMFSLSNSGIYSTKTNKVDDSSETEENNNTQTPKEPMETYFVYWDVREKDVKLDLPLFVGKNKPYTQELKISQDNLKSISFSLDWKDDLTTPIFHFGKDTLTFTIQSSDGTELFNKESRGEGHLYYKIDEINQQPLINVLNVKNKSDIDEIISDYYHSNLKDELILLDIHIKIGEIRPLRKYFEKGNHFDLRISYEFYEPDITDIEDTPPVTTIISSFDRVINTSQVELTWTAIDDFTPMEQIEFLYQLSEYGEWSSWTKKTSVIYTDLSEGDYTFFVRSRDHRGNIELNPAQLSFTVKFDEDKYPPETTIKSGPKGVISYNDVTFSWAGSDDATDSTNLFYSYKLTGYNSDWSDWSKITSKTFNDLPNGEYIFNVKSKDKAGNIDLSPAEQSFKIEVEQGDTKPPQTEILTGPSGVIDYNTVTFSWIGSDDETDTSDLLYSYKLIGYDPDWFDWSNAVTKTFNNLPNGDYTFRVRAKDNTNNIDLSPAERKFTIEVESGPNRFATKVIELIFGEDPLPDFMDPEKILGGPRGLGDWEGSLDVLTLGINGTVTLGFDVTVTDGPGKDFIVSENPFYIASHPEKLFAELMYVEVSTDGINFARFPSISNTTEPGLINPENVTNLAGVWPVYANVDKNSIDPFDPSLAGGDAFDLEDLINDPLVQSGIVDLQNIHFIKLIDIRGDGTYLDSQGNPIYDVTDIDNGADVDSIAIINYHME